MRAQGDQEVEAGDPWPQLLLQQAVDQGHRCGARPIRDDHQYTLAVEGERCERLL